MTLAQGRLTRLIGWSLLAAALACVPGTARAQGVSFKVVPGSSTVTPGSTFDLELQVTPAGSAFNAFDAVVEYDPAALTFVPLAPYDLQRGCLMTGACSAACGSTYHLFQAAGDSLDITLSLLCNNISLTGPGPVYKLRFTASNTPQVTHVRIRSAQFYAAGLFVNPLTTADADIGIGLSLDAPPAAAPAWRLTAGPNPARGAVALAIEAPEAGPQRLAVLDVSGRRVRGIDEGWQPAGVRRLRWDGTDASGARVAPGVYLVRLEAGGRRLQTRVIVLD